MGISEVSSDGQLNVERPVEDTRWQKDFHFLADRCSLFSRIRLNNRGTWYFTWMQHTLLTLLGIRNLVPGTSLSGECPLKRHLSPCGDWLWRAKDWDFTSYFVTVLHRKGKLSTRLEHIQKLFITSVIPELQYFIICPFGSHFLSTENFLNASVLFSEFKSLEEGNALSLKETWEICKSICLMIMWQTEMMHENQNQETPSKLYAIKKRVNNRKVMQSFCHSFYVSGILQSLWKKKNK